jgi:phosphoribosyl 1,2-cyclic phosphodiesterase
MKPARSDRPHSPKTLELVFLGTRGEIEKRTRRHRRHSVLLLLCRGARIMIDCGADWRGRVARLAPTAIVLTHGHPDHALGLVDGVSCPVYATKETWRLIDRYPIASRHIVPEGQPFSLQRLRFAAFPVVHSLRAPAVGYRITAGRVSIFYVPDVLAIPHRARALGGVRLYIGDGANLVRPIMRLQNGHPIGHAAVRAQLDWCAAEGVREALFTHCGTAVVAADGRRIAAKLRHLAREQGVAARFAHDGLRIVLSPQRRARASAIS